MGGLPEGIVQGESGVVVDEVSAEALTVALDSLLQDPSRMRRMSESAAKHAAQAFRWESVVEKIVDICEMKACSEEPVWLFSAESLGVYGSLSGLLG
jgi:glycosyltransferase involved in cell wall biosynthesis